MRQSRSLHHNRLRTVCAWIAGGSRGCHMRSADLSSGTHLSQRAYAERRRHLCRTLPPHTVLIIPAADSTVMSHDILYPFHQDAVFHHLFGLEAPLRRSLAPATAVATEDIHATMAVFVKDARGVCHVQLFVPETTCDMRTAVWATEPHPVDAVAASLAQTDALFDDGRVRVTGNSVLHVAANLVETITGLVSTQRAVLAGQHANTSADVKRLLPVLQVALPPQMRVHSERYRLLRASAGSSGAREAAERQSSARHVTALECGDEPSAVHFLHPLEALFAHLMAATFTISPHEDNSSGRTRVAATEARQRTSGGDRHRYHLCYTLPTRSGASAGESFALFTPPRETVATLKQWRAASSPAAPHCAQREPVMVPSLIRSARDTLWRYRLHKPPSQLAQHLISAHVTRDAFLAAMRAAATTNAEFDIHCAFEQSLLRSRRERGRRGERLGHVQSAYVPVVAAGEHATEIHYVENNGEAAIGDFVRLDAGAMVCHVPTDCTRTFPLGQTHFDLHSLKTRAYRSLLQLQRRLVKAIRAGVSPYSVAQLHVTLTRQHLVDLGVGESVPDQDEKAEKEAKRVLDPSLVHGVFCAHSYGHFFGIDLHEKYVAPPILSPPLPESAKAEKTVPAKPTLSYAPMRFDGGMMHTVEPGFYFPSAARAEACSYDPRAITLVPPALRGVGLQVEDDVFVLPAKSATVDVPVRSNAPSRADYLAAAVRAHHTLLQRDHATPDVRLPLCSLLSHAEGAANVATQCASRASLGFAAVSFLFEQRACMDSIAAAMAALHADASACAASFQLGESEGLARLAAHYPYDVIVTTACVPKEVEDIERLMAQKEL